MSMTPEITSVFFIEDLDEALKLHCDLCKELRNRLQPSIPVKRSDDADYVYYLDEENRQHRLHLPKDLINDLKRIGFYGDILITEKTPRGDVKRYKLSHQDSYQGQECFRAKLDNKSMRAGSGSSASSANNKKPSDISTDELAKLFSQPRV